LLIAVATSGSMGCASQQKPPSASPPEATALSVPAPPPPPAAAPRAPDAVESGLVFTVEPSESQISVDGRSYGTVADLADRRWLLPLAPGIYQVSLKAPGYVTWRAEVALRSGIEPIRVTLTRKP
jgi:hypothetical protein